jgi:transposase
LAGDTARAATPGEVKDLRREATALKEVVADLNLENRLLKNVWLAPSASVLLIWLINLHQRIRSQERILAKMELRAFRSS